MMRFISWLGCFGLLVAETGCVHASASGGAGAPPPLTASAPTAPNPRSATSPDATAKTPGSPEAPGASKVTATGKGPTQAELNKWVPTTMTPQDLAVKIDMAFRTLAGVVSEQHVEFSTPAGTGSDIMTDKFSKPNEFSVDSVVLAGVPPTPHRHRIIASGGMAVNVDLSGGTKSAFGPKFKYDPSGEANGPDLLSKWIGEFPRLAMGHFIEGKDVFVPLINTLMLPGSGFVTTCKVRTVKDNRGRIVTDYQITAKRTDEAKAKFGDAAIEIVVDGLHFVPVTMASIGVVPGGKKPQVTQLHWSAHWGSGKMSPADFKLPT